LIGFVEELPADTAIARFLHGTSDLVELERLAIRPVAKPITTRPRKTPSTRDTSRTRKP